jgi:hypothetical protein
MIPLYNLFSKLDFGFIQILLTNVDSPGTLLVQCPEIFFFMSK